MAPGGKKNNTVCIETGDGFTSTVRVIRPNEWWCPNKKCQDACTHPFGHWVWPKNKECNRCHTDRPTGKACKLFAGSKWANVQDKARGGPGGGGAKSGGPNRQNEKASEKEIRELKEEAAEAKRQKEIRRLKADRQQQQADNDENDETSDKSGSESNESMLRLEEQFALSDLQYAQKRYEARKKVGHGVNEALSVFEAAKTAYTAAQQAVRESKDPQEQLQKKTTKANRVLAAKNKLLDALKQEMVEKKEAEDKVKKHQEKIDDLIAKVEEKRAEQELLNREAFALQEQVVGAAPTGLSDLLEATGKKYIERLDDPLLANDESVKATRIEVDVVLKGICAALQKLEEINQKVVKGLDEARDATAKEAEAAANAAAEKAKSAETARNAAEAAKQPSYAETTKPGIAATSSASTATSGPKTARRARTDVVLETAMAKPIHERDEEETLATARAGKLPKTEQAADDMAIANVA